MKKRLSKLFQAFRQCRAGATAIEYGLIAALVALAIIPGVSKLSKRADDNLQCGFG